MRIAVCHGPPRGGASRAIGELVGPFVSDPGVQMTTLFRRIHDVADLNNPNIAKEIARIGKHPYVSGQPTRLLTPEDDRAFATVHEDDETPLPSGGRGAPSTGAKRARAEAVFGLDAMVEKYLDVLIG